MIKDDRLPKKIAFLQYFRQLPVQKLAAAKIGRNENTILDWKHEDPDFRDQIEDAKAEWALSQTKRVKSKEWLLERVLKDHFAERKELTGRDGKDLPTPLLQGVLPNVQTNDSTTKVAESQ